MLVPILVSSIFVLAVVILCLRKPNAGRIFLGIFFLIMAIGVNGAFTFFNFEFEFELILFCVSTALPFNIRSR